MKTSNDVNLNRASLYAEVIARIIAELETGRAGDYMVETETHP